MIKANMHEAKSNLSKLAEMAHQGETVVIAKAGKPYVDLVPHWERKVREPGGYYVNMDKFDVVDDISLDFYGIESDREE